MKSTLWRIVLIAVVLILSVIYVLPSIPAVRDSALQKILPDAQVNLGLDLKGGIYLTLGVDIDKAVENTLAQNGQEMRTLGAKGGIIISQPHPEGEDSITFSLTSSAKKAELDVILKDNFPQYDFATQETAGGAVHYTARFKQGERDKLEDAALDLALNTIRNRIDQFGVTEPDIRKQAAEKQIVIQLPGIDDPQRAIDIIGKTAHLEFRIQRDPATLDAAKISRGILPPGTVSLPFVEEGSGNMVVNAETVLTGSNIEDAYPTYDQFGKPAVGMKFNKVGGDIFERVTAENTGKAMAIVLDGKIYSAPHINEKISGGSAIITGNFTNQEASDLALVLKSGSLPAPVKIESERTVGPSLGQESIDKGVNAAVIGWSVIMIFIVIYYSWSGVIAAAMMALDVVILLACMAAFGATLTLPGIAGIVLTIGMAVDANVLIFERIREELRLGLSPYGAVETGFARATITIVDSNLTTIICAVILYEFGTGPVRGFAVTLAMGIVISMFTAVFVSRTIYDIWITKKSAKISI